MDYEHYIATVWGSYNYKHYTTLLTDVLSGTCLNCTNCNAYPELMVFNINTDKNITNKRIGFKLILHIEFNNFIITDFRFRWIRYIGHSKTKYNPSSSIINVIRNHVNYYNQNTTKLIDWDTVDNIINKMTAFLQNNNMQLVKPDIKSIDALQTYLYCSPLRYNFVRKFKHLFVSRSNMIFGYYQPHKIPKLFVINIDNIIITFCVEFKVINNDMMDIDDSKQVNIFPLGFNINITMRPYITVKYKKEQTYDVNHLLSFKACIMSVVRNPPILPYDKIDELIYEYNSVFERWNNF